MKKTSPCFLKITMVIMMLLSVFQASASAFPDILSDPALKSMTMECSVFYLIGEEQKEYKTAEKVDPWDETEHEYINEFMSPAFYTDADLANMVAGACGLNASDIKIISRKAVKRYNTGVYVEYLSGGKIVLHNADGTESVFPSRSKARAGKNKVLYAIWFTTHPGHYSDNVCYIDEEFSGPDTENLSAALVSKFVKFLSKKETSDAELAAIVEKNHYLHPKKEGIEIGEWRTVGVTFTGSDPSHGIAFDSTGMVTSSYVKNNYVVKKNQYRISKIAAEYAATHETHWYNFGSYTNGMPIPPENEYVTSK